MRRGDQNRRASPTIDTARERVERFLAEHGDPLPSIQTIARAVGCSRQYVYLVLPAGYQPGSAARRLDAFVKSCPNALLTKARGGMSFSQIAAQLGLKEHAIRNAWRLLAYPPRIQLKLTPQERSRLHYERYKDAHRQRTLAWRKEKPERWREIQLRADRRWAAKIIRNERCLVCGATFAWTNQHERGRRLNGRPVACSRPCALRARKAERAAMKEHIVETA